MRGPIGPGTASFTVFVLEPEDERRLGVWDGSVPDDVLYQRLVDEVGAGRVRVVMHESLPLRPDATIAASRRRDIPFPADFDLVPAPTMGRDTPSPTVVRALGSDLEFDAVAMEGQGRWLVNGFESAWTQAEPVLRTFGAHRPGLHRGAAWARALELPAYPEVRVRSATAVPWAGARLMATTPAFHPKAGRDGGWDPVAERHLAFVRLVGEGDRGGQPAEPADPPAAFVEALVVGTDGHGASAVETMARAEGAEAALARFAGHQTGAGGGSLVDHVGLAVLAGHVAVLDSAAEFLQPDLLRRGERRPDLLGHGITAPRHKLEGDTTTPPEGAARSILEKSRVPVVPLRAGVRFEARAQALPDGGYRLVFGLLRAAAPPRLVGRQLAPETAPGIRDNPGALGPVFAEQLAVPEEGISAAATFPPGGGVAGPFRLHMPRNPDTPTPEGVRFVFVRLRPTG